MGFKKEVYGGAEHTFFPPGAFLFSYVEEMRLRCCCCLFMAVAWCREEDVTLVSHLTPDKLWMVGELCLRWRGPVSLALWVNATEDLETRRSETTFLARRNGCRPFALTLAVDSGESYPVNRLRNMALAAVNTSHHLVSDMDFLPSNGLRTVARKRLMTFFDNKVAYVVPAFQKRGGNCKSVSSCRRRVEPLSLNIPKTFQSLKDCLALVEEEVA